MRGKTGKNLLSLCWRILIVVYIAVIVTCWGCVWQVLKTARSHLISRTFESACGEQFMLANSLVTHVKSVSLAIEDKNFNMADILTNALISFARYYTKDTTTLSVSDNTGSIIYSNIPLEIHNAMNLSPPKDTTASYCMRGVGDKTIIFVSSYVNLDGSFYRLDYAQDITGIVNDEINLSRQISIVLLIAVTLLLVVLYFLVTRMMRPLRQLGRQAREMAKGNYGLRVSVVHNDEVGSLANDFNHMAQAVQNHIITLSETAKARELFAANLAHELKTPITSIIGYADLAGRMEMESGKLYKMLDYIKNEGKRIDSLSSKLLRWSQINQKKSAEIRACKSSRIMEHVSNTITPFLQNKNQRLVINNETEIIFVDEALIISLLINLCKNSSQASKEGDDVIIELKNGNDNSVIIKVNDNGVGIDKDEIKNILEPFYMIDKARPRSQEGTGLGLSLCEAVVKAHNGKMTIESVKDKGTCVTAILFTNPLQVGDDLNISPSYNKNCKTEF